MICEKCNKAEATYDAPGNWCDDCWDDWWFQDYTPEQRAADQVFTFVCRAFIDVGNDNPTDDEVLAYMMKKYDGLDPEKVKEDIGLYREFQQGEKKS